MTRIALLLPSALVLAVPAPAAAAGAMNTPPAYAGSGSNVICAVQNLDAKERTVTARILLEDGSVTEGPTSVEVLAGGIAQIVNTGGQSPIVYCQFEGLTRKVRGSLLAIDSGGVRTSLPATK